MNSGLVYAQITSLLEYLLANVTRKRRDVTDTVHHGHVQFESWLRLRSLRANVALKLLAVAKVMHIRQVRFEILLSRENLGAHIAGE